MSKKRVGLLLPLAAIVALVLLVAVMAGFFRAKIEPGLSEYQSSDSASAVAATRQHLDFTEPVPASVEARESTTISSRLLARIVSIEVRAGDYVEEGQLLLRLESKDLLARAQQHRERIRALQVRLDEANKKLARAKELQQRGLLAVADSEAAQTEVLSLEAELASASEALAEAETAVSYAEIRSPIAGRIVDRFAEPGDTASPGAKLISLYNPFSLWVEAQVREALALSLAREQELTVEIPVLEKSLQARIVEIVPAADSGSRSFSVKAVLPSEQGLLPGMYARLLVPAGTRTSLVVPADRIAQIGQLNVLWVWEPGGAERRFVQLGRSVGANLVEVVAGLEEGEKVLPVP